MVDSANPSSHEVAQSPPAARNLNIPLIPLELWEQIFLVLFHGAVEDHVALGQPGILRQPWYGHAFKSLWLTCRALYMVGEQVRRRLHIIADRSPPKGSLDLERFSEFHKAEPKPEIIMQGAVWNMLPLVIKNVTGLERLELANMCLSLFFLKTVTGSDTLRSLRIRSCGSTKDLGPLPSHLQDKDVCDAIEVLRLKAVQLELDYTYWIPSQIHSEIPFLAFLPTIETLALCGKSFRAVTQLPRTLSPPPLQHLTITDNQSYSVDKEDVISYFARCSKLRTLDVDNSIQTSALAQGDTPANLPDLMEYKGPAELLTLLHAPNLRFALAMGFDWDGGAWIRSLFTTSPTLQSLVIELAAKAEDPVCKDIQASDEFFLLLFFILTHTHYIIDLGGASRVEMEPILAVYCKVLPRLSYGSSRRVDFLSKGWQNGRRRAVH